MNPQKELEIILDKIYNLATIKEIQQYLEKLLGCQARIVPDEITDLLNRIMALMHYKHITKEKMVEFLDELMGIQSYSSNIPESRKILFRRFISQPTGESKP